jgi:putative tricarboxylic transport membrane protein
VASEPINLLHTLIGVFIGTLISHLPGIGPSAGIALLIPVTFGMDPTQALIMLAGIYYGCMYGGAVTAILLNTPGDAAAMMTVLDGYPMARKGRAGAALAIAAVSSFIAGMFGLTALVFLAAPLANFGLRFGPAEYFSLMVFALTTVSALGGRSIAKGVMSTCFGLMLSTIGVDQQSGVQRFTMGIPDLQGGVDFLVVVVGMFAISEAGTMVEGTLRGTAQIIRIQGSLWFTRAEWRRAMPAIFRGTAIGFLCGAGPGLGGTMSSMLAYVSERKFGRFRHELGTGAVEGVAAPEAATNADTCGAFAHLLALGIPGSGATAVLMGAFIMYGIQPGPLLFRDQPDLVWGLIASMYVGNIMLLVLNLPLVGVLARILYIPPAVLLTIVLGIASAGVYSFNTNVSDLYIALTFGCIGYIFRKLDVPKPPMIFGLILGSLIEQSFRRAMTISGGDLKVFVTSPISATLLGLAIGSLLIAVWTKSRAQKLQHLPN